jgi:predicted HicB family RNase H-like nuclease
METDDEGRELKFTLRIREKLRDRLSEVAKRERRSLHSQIIHVLEQSVEREDARGAHRD